MNVRVLLGVIACMLLALTVAVVVLVGTLNRQAEHQAYLDCMARAGYAADDPELVNTDLDAVTDAAERCSS